MPQSQLTKCLHGQDYQDHDHDEDFMKIDDHHNHQNQTNHHSHSQVSSVSTVSTTAGGGIGGETREPWRWLQWARKPHAQAQVFLSCKVFCIWRNLSQGISYLQGILYLEKPKPGCLVVWLLAIWYITPHIYINTCRTNFVYSLYKAKYLCGLK